MELDTQLNQGFCYIYGIIYGLLYETGVSSLGLTTASTASHFFKNREKINKSIRTGWVTELAECTKTK